MPEFIIVVNPRVNGPTKDRIVTEESGQCFVEFLKGDPRFNQGRIGVVLEEHDTPLQHLHVVFDSTWRDQDRPSQKMKEALAQDENMKKHFELKRDHSQVRVEMVASKGSHNINMEWAGYLRKPGKLGPQKILCEQGFDEEAMEHAQLNYEKREPKKIELTEFNLLSEAHHFRTSHNMDTVRLAEVLVMMVKPAGGYSLRLQSMRKKIPEAASDLFRLECQDAMSADQLESALFQKPDPSIGDMANQAMLRNVAKNIFG